MRVPVGLKAAVVGLLVMGAYAAFSNSIPQIESRPPQELKLEGGTVTPAQLVKAGQEIFKAKGTCEVCHRIGQKGTRAPDLAGIGTRAARAKPGTSAKQYIIESLLNPGAVVVEGYPPIMPAVDKPPIALNRSEVWALTAYLQSLGGTPDVALNDIPASVGAAPPLRVAEVDAPVVREVRIQRDVQQPALAARIHLGDAVDRRSEPAVRQHTSQPSDPLRDEGQSFALRIRRISVGAGS